jgi:hypothetical protein
MKLLKYSEVNLNAMSVPINGVDEIQTPSSFKFTCNHYEPPSSDNLWYNGYNSSQGITKSALDVMDELVIAIREWEKENIESAAYIDIDYASSITVNYKQTEINGKWFTDMESADPSRTIYRYLDVIAKSASVALSFRFRFDDFIRENCNQDKK